MPQYPIGVKIAYMTNLPAESGCLVSDENLKIINLKDYYSMSQVMEVVGFHRNMDFRMQIKRWRETENIWWAILGIAGGRGTPLYLREEVNNWVRNHKDLTFKEKRKLEEVILSQTRHFISLENWIPYIYAIDRWQRSYEHFCTISVRTGFPSIRVRRVPEFKINLYNYNDMRRWEHAANTMSTEEFLEWEKQQNQSQNTQ